MVLLVCSGPICGLDFDARTVVEGKLQIVKKGSIRTALHNGTFFPRFDWWLLTEEQKSGLRKHVSNG
jgi:hypothetical protein